MFSRQGVLSPLNRQREAKPSKNAQATTRQQKRESRTAGRAKKGRGSLTFLATGHLVVSCNSSPAHGSIVMQDFAKWEVITLSRKLAVCVYKLMPHFPADERFGLCQQLRRASVSVGNNLAEGAGRNSRKDKAHFLTQAIGSASEVEYLLLISEDLEFITSEVRLPLSRMARNLKFKIHNLRRSILSSDEWQ
jgi:four helix bundle protein